MALNEAVGLINRFTTIDKGYIITTGNSLILSEINSNGLSGPFITTDTSKQVPNYPVGTTWAWEENSSMAKLDLATGSTILYAELIWYSTPKCPSRDLSSYENATIEFKTPTGTFNISPSNTQRENSESNLGAFKTFHSAEVTNLIKNSGSGDYTVGKVPSVNGSDWGETRCGWALTVVVGNFNERFRFLRVDTGVVLTEESGENVLLDDFYTPSSGVANGRFNLVAANGGNFLDSSKAGTNLNSLITLGNAVGTGNPNPGNSPNNPYDNVFCGVINIADNLNPDVGMIDNRGTFGYLNHDGFLLQYNSISRNRWDISSLDLAPALANNETQLVISNITNGQTSKFEFIQLAVQVDMYSPEVLFEVSVDKSKAYVDEILTYSAIIINNDNFTINNVIIKNLQNDKITFVNGSVEIDGVIQPTFNASTGFSIGNITPSQVISINYKVRVIEKPNDLVQSKLNNNITMTYSFSPTPNITIDEVSEEKQVSIDILDIIVNEYVDLAYADKGYTLNYSVTIENIGHSSANNIKITSPIPYGTSFITDTFKVNGASQTGANPKNSVLIMSILGKSTTTLAWKVKVDKTFPEITTVSNASTIDTQTGVIKNTNTVTTTINHADLIASGNFVKSVDKSLVGINDLVTYTINIRNTGNVSANNITLTDVIEAGAIFSEGSLMINGVSQNGNPNLGIALNSIAPNEITEVLFTIQITSLPTQNPIANSATINYFYTVNPTLPNRDVISGNSNSVTTKVNHADLLSNGNVIKSVNKQFAKVSDILTYSLILTNKGNISADNVVITETLSDEIEFISGSVMVNNMADTVADPLVGINIASIPATSTATVIFNAKINSLPSNGVVNNNATFHYSYNVYEINSNMINASGSTNTVATTVIKPNFYNFNNGINSNFFNTADKIYVDINDLVTYTLTIKNTGNTVATNVILRDVIQEGAMFKAGSVIVNNISKPLANPNIGINLGNIFVDETVVVSFNVIITSIPPTTSISNKATLLFNYTLNPAYPNGESDTLESNNISIIVNHADLKSSGNLVKTVDKQFTDLNEILTYSIKIKNTGNVAATNVLLLDSMSNEVSFENGSVKINGSTNTSNPKNGINVGVVNVGETKTITFKGKVLSIPNNNILQNRSSITYKYTVNPSFPDAKSASNISNIVNTKVNTASISCIEVVDKSYATLNDILLYNITLTNTGNTLATDMVFKGNIPNGVSYVDNSLTISGMIQLGSNPLSGVVIGNIEPSDSISITFQVKIGEDIPEENPIESSSEVSYYYLVNPSGVKTLALATSNKVFTQVNYANLLTNNSFVKSVDKQYVDIGDLITYTINIKNNGNTSANNIIVTDILPTGLIYKSGSLSVNGAYKSDNPSSGINIGALSAKQTKSIVFNAEVTSLPDENPANNVANISYNYNVDTNENTAINVTGNSNLIFTQINHADLESTGNVIQSINKKFAKIGDEVIFTITFKNSGNVNAENVKFTDSLPKELTFLSNTFNIDGVLVYNANLILGVNIGTLNPGQSKVISFKAKINTLPKSKILTNIPNVTYSYIVDTNLPDAVSINLDVNAVNITVVQPEFSTTTGINGNNFYQSTDKNYADLNDLITYSFNIKNVGNTLATNCILNDILPSNVLFNKGSVFINGINKPFDNPSIGINLSIIYPNQTILVTFEGKIVTIPPSNKVENYATLSFNYTLDPDYPDREFETLNSNITLTNIVHGELINKHVVMSTDKYETTVKDIITYTIDAKNTGNTAIHDVIVENIIPEGTSFVESSVLINSIARINENPTNGINIGSIAPGKTTKLNFQLYIDEDAPFLITNSGDLKYNYTVDPTKAKVVKSMTTNKVIIQNSTPKLDINFTSNRIGAINGNIIRYTIIAKNIGQTKIENLMLKNALPKQLEFVGNVTLNGTPTTGDITLGINVGDLDCNSVIILDYDVKLNLSPIRTFNLTEMKNELGITSIKDEIAATDAGNTNVLSNEISVFYGYSANNGNFFTSSTNSNTFTIQMYNPSVVLQKTCNKTITKVGDTFIYTITATNNGDLDVEEGILKDVLPVQFSVEEIKLDGVITVGNISTGLSIGPIAKGATKVISLTVRALDILTTNDKFKNEVIGEFKVLPDANLPLETITVQAIENEGIKILKPLISVVKSNSVKRVAVGDIVEYTILVKNIGDVNTGNVILLDVVVKDPLASELNFVQGSLKINGLEYPNENISAGVNIGDLDLEESRTLTFNVKIIAKKNTPVVNNANVEYKVKLDANSPLQLSKAFSNEVELLVNKPNLRIIKTADNQAVSLNDKVNYTVTISNDGDLDLINLVFNDNISLLTKVIDGTFSINGRIVHSVELDKGVTLGALSRGNNIIIKYTALVTGADSSGKIENKATVNYSYIFSDGTTGTQENESNNSIVLVNISNFKQLSVNEFIKLSEEKPDIKNISNTTATVDITKFNIIETLKSKSIEGQEVNGYKLVIHGLINGVAEYVSDDLTESVHGISYKVPFSTFIMLPSNFNPRRRLDVNAIIENVDGSKSDSRSLYFNSVLLVTAKVFEC